VLLELQPKEKWSCDMHYRPAVAPRWTGPMQPVMQVVFQLAVDEAHQMLLASAAAIEEALGVLFEIRRQLAALGLQQRKHL